jgi:hypothetical protein
VPRARLPARAAGPRLALALWVLPTLMPLSANLIVIGSEDHGMSAAHA